MEGSNIVEVLELAVQVVQEAIQIRLHYLVNMQTKKTLLKCFEVVCVGVAVRWEGGL